MLKAKSFFFFWQPDVSKHQHGRQIEREGERDTQIIEGKMCIFKNAKVKTLHKANYYRRLIKIFHWHCLLEFATRKSDFLEFP